MRYRHLVFILTIFICSSLFAAPKTIQNNAFKFANDTWGAASIDEGVTYLGSDGNPSVYCFTVAMDANKELSPQNILNQVNEHRLYRLAKEQLLTEALTDDDMGKASYARSLINLEWAKMRDEENFATVYMSANEEFYEPLEYYRGLPLHYVSIFDAKDVGKTRLAKKVEISRLLFDGPFSIFVELKNENGKTIVDLLNPLNSEFDKKQLLKAFNPTIHTQPFSYPMFLDQAISKASIECDYESWETKISGVPDYQTIYSRGCAPAAAGCVLGYWDDNGYPNLVDGGGSGYAGSECNNGYLTLTWCELADSMDFVSGTGTYVSDVDDGIRKVTNDENNYNFSVSNGTWYSTASADRSTFHDEIDDGYPLVYTMQYSYYGNGEGFHAVAGIGYKIKEYDPPCSDIYYYRIVHDNSTATGTDVHLSEDLIETDPAYDTHIITVHASASKKSIHFSSFQPGEFQLALDNYPNPFNPSTTIHYSIPNDGHVAMNIYTVTGRLVQRFDFGLQAKGQYNLAWDAALSQSITNSGLYFVELQTDQGRLVKKISFIK